MQQQNPNQVFQTQQEAYNRIALEFTEPTQTDDFRMKVCIPYFKDIYKDLCSRSDDKNKGINKISMLDYC